MNRRGPSKPVIVPDEEEDDGLDITDCELDYGFDTLSEK